MALPSLTLRTTKGSALTYAEADANFTNLSTASTLVTVGSTTTTLALNDTLTLAAGANVTLTANSSTKTITIASTGSGGITDIVNDTTPQLGGDLDVNGKRITSTAGGSIYLEPDGAGLVILNTAEVRVGDVNVAAYITSQGAGNLILGTNYSASTSSYITLNHGVSANIDIVPSGTGDLNVNADTLRLGDSGATATLTTNGAGDLVLNTNAGTNSGSITIGNGASGNITIAADGTGDIHLNSNAVRVGRNNSTVAELATAGTTPLKIYPNEGSTAQPFINLGEGANGAITIASTGSGNISLTTATGSVIIAGTTWPSSKGTNGYLLQTNGSGTASWVSTSTLGIPASYTLTTATAAALGGVKIGSGLTAAGDGTISASGGLSSFTETVYAYGNSGTLTWAPSFSNGTIQTITLTGNLTMNAFTGVAAGQTITFVITQDGTGSRTLTSTFKFAGGFKTLTTTAAAVDILTVTAVTTSTYYASLSRGFA